MRIAIVGVCFSFATAALCQSPAPTSVKPQGQQLTQPQSPQHNQDFNLTQRSFQLETLPQATLFIPHPASAPQIEIKMLGPKTVDPQMVLHPPQSSLGDQALGTQIAQSLYPGLTLLPIDEWKGKAQQIPIAWPNAQIKNISIVWQKTTIVPAQTTPAENAPKPGK
jgi:hypothetical protein